MTDIDQAVVEVALSARCGHWSVRQLFADEDEAPEIMCAALQAINLPDLLRKEREYDAMMAEIEAAPVGEAMYYSHPPMRAITGVSINLPIAEIGRVVRQRVRLLVEQEG